jgi:hypothetical protein
MGMIKIAYQLGFQGTNGLQGIYKRVDNDGV